MRKLKYLTLALFAVLMSVGFAACSNDDGEDSKEDELISIITGSAWSQDGDNDIIVVSKDGTGFEYENSDYYKAGIKDGWTFTWSYSDDIVTVKTTARYYDGVKDRDINSTARLRVVSYDKAQIVFLRIDDGNDLWTWTRYVE